MNDPFNDDTNNFKTANEPISSSYYENKYNGGSAFSQLNIYSEVTAYEMGWNSTTYMGDLIISATEGGVTVTKNIPIYLEAGNETSDIKNLKTVKLYATDYSSNGSVSNRQMSEGTLDVLSPWLNTTTISNIYHNMGMRFRSYIYVSGGQVKVQYYCNGVVRSEKIISSSQWVQYDWFSDHNYSYNMYVRIFDYTPPTTQPPTCLVGKDHELMVRPNKFKKVSNLKVGDMVYTAHENTLEWGEYEIINYAEYDIDSYLIVKFEDGSEIKCSDTHQFMSEGVKKTINDMLVGDTVMKTGTELGEFVNVEIVDIELVNEPEKCYEVDVDIANTYVTENYIFQHNRKPPIEL
jgi:hypothetical protein